MPSILQELVAVLGGEGLDEKALAALTEQLHPVNALSILHNCYSGKAEVRNPSAFVSSSVKKANQQGGPGQKELQNALATLNQNGTLDDNAIAKISTAQHESACAAIAALLSQENGSVRNASAYVNTSIKNANMQQPQMQMRHPPAAMAPIYQVQRIAQVGGGSGRSAAASPLMSKWEPLLDQRAVDALRELGNHATNDILQEMDAKGAAVRNASAYIQKSVANFKSGNTRPGGPPRTYDFLAAYRGVLDEKSLLALTELGEEHGSTILANLEQKGESVRNPSAWIMKSIANSRSEGGPPAPAFPLAYPPSYPHPAYASMYPPQYAAPQYAAYNPAAYQAAPARPAMRENATNFRHAGVLLDAKADEALKSIGPEGAQKIFNEFQAKSGGIRNPSAYVTKAVANAVLEGAPKFAPGEAGYGSESRELDAAATKALEEIGPEAAAVIMEQLEGEGEKVRNPSAYVVKAVGNARRGKGAGGKGQEAQALNSFAAAPPPESLMTPDMSMEELLAPWRENLDEKCLEKLESVGIESAYSILTQLESRGDQVRNASAFVMKSCGNAQKGGGKGNAMPEVDYETEFAAELAPLDEKALNILKELGSNSAAHILQQLRKMEGSVKNPSAYIMKAAANEKRGGPSFGAPLAKRPRVS